MKLYKYKAINLQGEHFDGLEYSKGADELSFLLRQRGCYLLKSTLVSNKKIFDFVRKINLKDISIFSRQFGSMLSAGFNISQALDILEKETYSKVFKKNIKAIKIDIARGNSFYDSIIKREAYYPKFYLEMINIGEQSGKLDAIVSDLSNYYLKEFLIVKKIKSSLVYPAIILISSVVMFFYIEVSIVPMFMDTFKSLGQDIPAYSKVTMNFSKFIIINWPIILMLLTTIIMGILKIIKYKKIRYLIDKTKLSVPLINVVYKKILGARFTRCLGILQQSGVNLINSIEMISNVLNNVYIKDRLDKVILEVKNGNSIADSLQNINILPDFAVSMISIGEQGGNLEEMMNLSADMYEQDVGDIIEKAVSFVEPALIILLGAIIGSVIISVMVPMLKMMQTI
ncbi:type II secretion system F family protein [Clostridium akagii]|uniref:type II secretion system F family protein n=1 Tax=Clostridium akagii TaxID=91623 RepID=UPI00047A7FA1|nr:type II secretion system F family protein [Clostridium akagii]